MANKPPKEYVFLPLLKETFNTAFKREGIVVPASNAGNNGIFFEGSMGLRVAATDIVLKEVKSSDDFANNLKNTLRRSLAERHCTPSDSITVLWKINFISKSLAIVELSVSGDFFEKFVAEYRLPVAVKLWFGLKLGIEWVSIESEEMSPILFIVKNSTGEPRICVFKDTFQVETEKLIPIDINIPTRITIGIAANRSVATKALSCKTGMIVQSILENKIESDFAIIAEDETRFECHKAFLAINSQALAGMILMECKETKEKSMKLQMSAKAIDALLKFMYYASVEDPMQTPSIALELLEIGHQYNILGLEEAMRTLFLEQANEWCDIDTALLLYLRTLKVEGNEDLKWKALKAFKSKPSELKASTVFDKLMKDDSEGVKDLIAICFWMK